MKYRTRESAISNVKQFFANNPSDDTISLQDAFSAWGRNLEDVKGNMSWFYNKLTHLKYHNLVRPLYAVRNSKRVLDKIQLTMEGKKALGRIEGNQDSNDKNSQTNNSSLSIADVMKIVSRLRKENSDYEITFDVKLKNI
jgi:hypothetical protein